MSIAITAALLYILISEFGGISAPDNRWKILGLVVITIVLEQVARAQTEGLLLHYAALAIITIALAAAMRFWLKMEQVAALKVAALFFSIRIAVGLAVLWLFGRLV